MEATTATTASEFTETRTADSLSSGERAGVRANQFSDRLSIAERDAERNEPLAAILRLEEAVA